jgi:hypothetical protein
VTPRPDPSPEQLFLSSEGWIFVLDRDLEQGGWLDPLADDDQLISTKTAFRIQQKRNRPIRDLLP